MSTVASPPIIKQVTTRVATNSPLDLLPRRHIPALDAVRGLAILIVTLYRFRAGPDDASLAGQIIFPALNLGMRGVDLFFVLSGFLITEILYDTKHQPHFFRDFYVRRVLRIFPLYYGVLLLSFFVLPALWPGPSPWSQAAEHQAWLWTYSANLLIASTGKWNLGCFDHFWSLAVEEHFYLLWPLVIYACSRRTAIRITAALIVASAVGRVAWLMAGGNNAAAEVFTLFRLDALLIGAWFALVARGPHGLTKLVPLARRVAWVTGLLLLPEIILQRRLLTVPTTLYAAFFGALIVLAITAKPASWSARFWNSRVLRHLGKYSYGMYVFQYPLIPLLAALFTAESLTLALGSALWGRLSYIALMFAATWLAALVSWHFYEKHFLKLKTFFGGDGERCAKSIQ
jgi:peptidoglycan/LPS O-acetylase OafA/YrhL